MVRSTYMKPTAIWLLSCLFLAPASVPTAFAQATLHVDTATVVSPVSPTLYGLMTEEINYSYDGGLYAEMVRNRTFVKTWEGFEHWTVFTRGDGQSTMNEGDEGPSAALTKSLKLTIEAGHGGEAGIANEGYWGMAVRPATAYRGSFYAKSSGVGAAHVRLIANDSGATLAEAIVDTTDGAWKQYEYTLTTGAGFVAGERNHLAISFAHSGSVLLQLASVFPPTFHGRVNGNRADLMEMMARMHPTFLRLPGGNYLEGDSIKDRFEWKDTVGPLVDRPTHKGPWGYQSTDGLGLLEYLEWCEDLKMEPLLAVYAGYSLGGEHVVGKDLEPFVQEALDEIEYVTGDASTKWGAVRARNGHAAAFPLHFIEIGNEDNFDKSKSYDERFSQMAAAIRGKYPEYKLIATMPVSKGNPDLVDDHYYKLPEEFFAMVHKYDTYDRKGPKVFVGEWATRTGSPTPDFGAALGDAAWMTGMERNSDLILMASYAPLLTNVNPGGMQWSTDLIGYDAMRSYRSPSYWAQVMFAEHLGDVTVKSDGEGLGSKVFWSATVSRGAKVLHLKLVNASDTAQEMSLAISGAKAGMVAVTRLQGATRFATNSLEVPDAIQPAASQVQVPAGEWRYSLAANTIEVLDIPLS